MIIFPRFSFRDCIAGVAGSHPLLARWRVGPMCRAHFYSSVCYFLPSNVCQNFEKKLMQLVSAGISGTHPIVRVGGRRCARTTMWKVPPHCSNNRTDSLLGETGVDRGGRCYPEQCFNGNVCVKRESERERTGVCVGVSANTGRVWTYLCAISFA